MAKDQAAQPQPNDEVERLRADVARMTAQLADATAQIVTLSEAQAAMTGHTLDPSEVPAYELTQPWFSPDCIYYPEGVRFEDVTGTIIPNETMIPLNEPARQRLDAYLSRLPSQGVGTPSMEDIIDAAMQTARKLGSDPQSKQDFARVMMHAALEARFQRIGGSGDAPQRTAQRIPTNVPLMTNTEIRNDAGMPLRPGTNVSRGPAMTRALGARPEPTQPVLGSVPSTPLSQNA